MRKCLSTNATSKLCPPSVDTLMGGLVRSSREGCCTGIHGNTDKWFLSLMLSQFVFVSFLYCGKAFSQTAKMLSPQRYLVKKRSITKNVTNECVLLFFQKFFSITLQCVASYGLLECQYEKIVSHILHKHLASLLCEYADVASECVF